MFWKRFRKILKWLALGLVSLLLGALVFFYFDNRSLPSQSPLVDRLSQAEKARLLEVDHLRRQLGNTIWPGWGDIEAPFVVYNEKYAFCLTVPDPAPGWTMATGQQRGGVWEAVPDDRFDGQVYYRQLLASPDLTPENFIAQVGGVWGVTMQTEEYSAIAFYQGFREELPPLVREVFPYRLMWSLLLGGGSEGQVAGLAHEAFHAFQAQQTLPRLQAAEAVAGLEDGYPFEDPQQDAGWQTEQALLVQAVRAPDEVQARDLARRYLAARRQRQASLSAGLANYERQREWLEGLAKYAELALSRAGASSSYQPTDAILADPNFHGYAGRVRVWEQQIDEVGRMNGYHKEFRFYMSGFGQAALLDRLMPGWKARAMQDGVFLDGLLAEAVSN